MIRVAHLVWITSRKNGGLSVSVPGLARALEAAGQTQNTVWGLRDSFAAEDAALWTPLAPRTYAAWMGCAPCFTRDLIAHAPDMVHCNGLWRYHVVACLRWQQRTSRPYILSLHGMLTPWAFSQSKWKKKVALLLYQGQHLRQAAILHALCEREADFFREFGLRNPVCVIPNGIEKPPPPPNEAPPWVARVPTGRKVLLYLGRLHPNKGLHFLLDAWARTTAREDWVLVVAGWEQEGVLARLEAQVRALGLEDRVFFVGPLFGPAKEAALWNATAFILPSEGEALPMSVLEAWAHERPVLMTPQCNLPEGFAAGAALRAEPEAGSLAEALEQLFRMSDADRSAMGRKGRELVERRFLWPRIAAQMNDVYRWVLGGGSPPASLWR
jgi:poly(glycerol-phosphate) alpha-glucosyltransferase